MGKMNFKEYAASVKDDLATKDPELYEELEAYRERLVIGRQLRALRRQHGMTQQELAALTGIGQSEISKIERGEANSTQDTLTALFRPFGGHIRVVTDAGQLAGELVAA